MTCHDLRHFKVILPPKGEQRSDRVPNQGQTQRWTEAIRIAQREIDLIREYRTRLIADVVTGKVDVRHLAPSPEAMGAEAEPEDLDDETPGEDEGELAEEVTDADD